jgi:hypothetical protein
MLTIIKIEWVEEKKDRKGRTYWKTHALLSDGTEAVGFGKDFDLGMGVVAFYHREHIKMKKYRMPSD